MPSMVGGGLLMKEGFQVCKLMPWHSSLEVNKSITGIRGFTRQVLIAVVAHIETTEFRTSSCKMMWSAFSASQEILWARILPSNRPRSGGGRYVATPTYHSTMSVRDRDLLSTINQQGRKRANDCQSWKQEPKW